MPPVCENLRTHEPAHLLSLYSQCRHSPDSQRVGPPSVDWRRRARPQSHVRVQARSESLRPWRLRRVRAQPRVGSLGGRPGHQGLPRLQASAGRQGCGCSPNRNTGALASPHDAGRDGRRERRVCREAAVPHARRGQGTGRGGTRVRSHRAGRHAAAQLQPVPGGSRNPARRRAGHRAHGTHLLAQFAHRTAPRYVQGADQLGGVARAFARGPRGPPWSSSTGAA